MGADQFESLGFGKTMEAAFLVAREDAAWDSGHGGYTGTLAEKDSFVDFGQVPARYNLETVINNTLDWKRNGYWEERVKVGAPSCNSDWHTHEPNDCPYPQQTYRRVKRRKDPRPKALQSIVTDRMLSVYDEDKWGPAVGVELTGQKAKEMKERHGLKGTHNKVYLFCGWASS